METFEDIVKRIIIENKPILDSLRDYDEGKKDISIVNIKNIYDSIQTQ